MAHVNNLHYSFLHLQHNHARKEIPTSSPLLSPVVGMVMKWIGKERKCNGGNRKKNIRDFFSTYTYVFTLRGVFLFSDGKEEAIADVANAVDLVSDGYGVGRWATYPGTIMPPFFPPSEASIPPMMTATSSPPPSVAARLTPSTLPRMLTMRIWIVVSYIFGIYSSPSNSRANEC